MSKEYIARALKRLRENTGFTADEVGAKIGKSGKTVNAWENGRGQPDAEMLIKLCDIYRVSNILAEFDDKDIIKSKRTITIDEFNLLDKYRSLDYFGKKTIQSVIDIEYERCNPEEGETEEETEPMLKIKHYEYKVSAGHGFEFFADEEWDEIDVPDTRNTRRADFALTIQGDSMEPVYHDGDIVLVKRQDAVDVGQIGIFVLNGAGYIKKNGGDRLISLNEKYDDILIEEYDDCRCAGKVIGRV